MMNSFIYSTTAIMKLCTATVTQPAVTCSKLAIQTLVQGVKYV